MSSSTHNASPQATSPRRAFWRTGWGRWLVRAALVLLALVLLWMSTWIIVPLAKNSIAGLASRTLGRTVTLGDIAFSPWSLELVVKNITIAAAAPGPVPKDTPHDATEGARHKAQDTHQDAHKSTNTPEGTPAPAPQGLPPLLTVKQLDVRLAAQTFRYGAPVVDALVIDEPRLHLTHEGQGRLDIQDILDHLASPTPTPSSGPARLALYNMAVHGGSIELVDTPTRTTHTLQALELAIPFISTLPVHRTITVTPRLAMVVNGVPLESQAVATPFSDTGAGSVQLRWEGMDAEPYLHYWPAHAPVRLQRGQLDVDVTVAFTQHPEPSMRVSGMVQAHKVDVTDAQRNPLFSAQQLRVDIQEMQPLQGLLHLSRITIDQPQVHASRSAQGQLNWLQLTAPASPAQASSTASAPTPAPAPAAKPNATPALRIATDAIRIDNGQIHWSDATTTPTANVQAKDIDLSIEQVTWPLQRPAQLHGAMAVAGGKLAWQGIINPQGMDAPLPAPRSANARTDTSAPPAKASPAETPATPATPATPTTASAATAAPSTPANPAPPAIAKAARPAETHAAPPAGLPLGSAHLHLQVQGLDLTTAAPYLSAVLRPSLAGALHAEADVRWRNPRLQSDMPATATGLSVEATDISIADMTLTQGPRTLASWQRLSLGDLHILPDSHTVRLGQVQLQQPQADISRNAQGQWMASDWLLPPPPAAPNTTAAASAKATATPVTAPATVAPAPQWKVELGTFTLDRGAFNYADATNAPHSPIAISLTGVALQAGPWTYPIANQAATPVRASVRMSTLAANAALAERSTAGTVTYQGSVALQPLAAQGTVQATRIPLHPFNSYVADTLTVGILRAYASYQGSVHWAAPATSTSDPRLQLAGNIQLDDLQVNSTAAASNDIATPAGEDLLAWKSLQLQGFSLNMGAGPAPRIKVEQTSLNDFFARVTLAANGQFNLGQIIKKPAPPAGTSTNTTTARATPRPAPAAPPAPAQATSATLTQEDQAAAAAAAPTPATNTASVALPVPPPDPRAPIIQMGPTSLINGRVLFSDYFIKPNYSADLSELTGQLGAFASQPPDGKPQLAQLSLRGVAEGSADLEITGQLNPLAQPLALNIEGKMRNLDLPPLSPYAIKYAGHDIQRGKLSAQVQYAVTPDGQLTANNRIVLNQLQFGEAIEGAPNSLPVRLAVALLADRKGVIDLELPITGSINDPTFSIGPIVFKAIVNIIGKALLSPFSLLAKALGGNDDLSSVPFAPGSNTLTAEAQANLAKVAQALTDRPALQVTITGTAHLGHERDGLQREQLQQQLLAEHRRQHPDTSSAPAALSTEVRDALLKAVYQRTDMPKPKNALGLTKDIAPADMEKLLLARITPTPRMALELARQRAATIEHYLLTHQLPTTRIVVAAPNAITQTAPDSEPWTPQAQLSLGMP